MAERDANVETLMSSPVQTTAPDATIAEAAQVLTSEGIGSLVVGDEQVTGIVTEKDIVESVATETDPATPVSEIMSDPVVTIRRTDTLQVAAERMGHNGVKKLPVVEDGAAIGIITTTDLALHLPDYQVSMAHQAEPDIVDGEWE
ncbi:MAG: CBS domain-containing protein [Natronomonas sp.]|jgi:CBS domain-containing protein